MIRHALTRTVGAIALAVLASQANAAEQPRWPNWYVGLNGGIGWYPKADVEVNTSPTPTTAELETNTGWMWSVTLGYLPRTTMPFFNQSRIELEYAFRTNENDSVNGAGLMGDTEAQAAMANLYFDFPNTTIFTPYVGGGMGLASVQVDNGAGISVEDDVFAWQLMAGLSWSPESIPMTSWNIGYRYFTTEDVEYPVATFAASQEYSFHGLEAGAKFRF